MKSGSSNCAAVDSIHHLKFYWSIIVAAAAAAGASRWISFEVRFFEHVRSWPYLFIVHSSLYVSNKTRRDCIRNCKC